SPDGPATMAIFHEGNEVHVRSWGPGAKWCIDWTPTLIGEKNIERPQDRLTPKHKIIKELMQKMPGMRVVRTGAVIETLIPTVISQRLTSIEAHRSWSKLVRQLSEPAPGPGKENNLYLPPTPEKLAGLASWAFHRLGIERKRAETIRRIGCHAKALQATIDM